MKLTNIPIKVGLFFTLLGTPWMLSIYNSADMLLPVKVTESKIVTSEQLHLLTMGVVAHHMLRKAICKKPIVLNLPLKMPTVFITSITSLAIIQTSRQFF
jgi:hypothetical protein